MLQEEMKQQKDESDHKMHILQMMGNMVTQIAATLMQ